MQTTNHPDDLSNRHSPTEDEIALDQLQNIPQPPDSLVLTIGMFDGVHLGHRHLLERLIEIAEKNDCKSGILTFLNHPKTVLQPEAKISYLATTDKRIQLLRETGVDFIASVAFTPALSRLPPRKFLKGLYKHLNMRGLVAGPDLALGHRRQGTVPVLRKMGGELGFFVESVAPLRYEGQAVSSTAIRGALAQGDMGTVSQLLGRKFQLTGQVIRGEGRGRDLGFPTANLLVDPGLALPADGIYATLASVDGRWHKSATSIGIRPTFDDSEERTVETFILDFNRNIYSADLTLKFIQRLRDEVAFPTPQALIHQMREDIEQARTVLETTQNF